jgi:hypothetical protein
MMIFKIKYANIYLFLLASLHVLLTELTLWMRRQIT